MAVCFNEEVLQAYCDGELAPAAAAAVWSHLTGCAVCAGLVHEIEQAMDLINKVLLDELPEHVPTTQLRVRVEEAVAATPSLSPALTVFSTLRRWRNSLAVRWLVAGFSLRPVGLFAVASLIVVVLSGGLASKFWPTAKPAWKEEIARQVEIPVEGPTLTAQPQPLRSQPLGHSGRQASPRGRRIARSVLRAKPVSVQAEPLTRGGQTMVHAVMRHPKPAGSATFLEQETSEHLRQTQLLLRSFRNTSQAAGEAGQTAFDLTYEKGLSRELLNKNRLLRRSAGNKDASQASELLGHLEPLLLDIANLPDKPSETEVGSIKELIREQKIIATLQFYAMRAGY